MILLTSHVSWDLSHTWYLKEVLYLYPIFATFSVFLCWRLRRHVIFLFRGSRIDSCAVFSWFSDFFSFPRCWSQTCRQSWSAYCELTNNYPYVQVGRVSYLKAEMWLLEIQNISHDASDFDVSAITNAFCRKVLRNSIEISKKFTAKDLMCEKSVKRRCSSFFRMVTRPSSARRRWPASSRRSPSRGGRGLVRGATSGRAHGVRG